VRHGRRANGDGPHFCSEKTHFCNAVDATLALLHHGVTNVGKLAVLENQKVVLQHTMEIRWGQA
jgi:hypothetical protein